MKKAPHTTRSLLVLIALLVAASLAACDERPNPAKPSKPTTSLTADARPHTAIAPA
jgi:ABC-type uncharacterized transport system auxiliary subunit